MKLGFIFPGQGAQFEGMGKNLYESHEEVKEVYEKVKKEMEKVIFLVCVSSLFFGTKIEQPQRVAPLEPYYLLSISSSFTFGTIILFANFTDGILPSRTIR